VIYKVPIGWITPKAENTAVMTTNINSLHAEKNRKKNAKTLQMCSKTTQIYVEVFGLLAALGAPVTHTGTAWRIYTIITHNLEMAVKTVSIVKSQIF